MQVLKKGSVALGAVAVVLVAVSYLQAVTLIDPFAKLKETTKQLNANIGVEMRDVSIQSYEGQKLVSTAMFDRMEVRSDRQFYAVYGVHNGTYYTPKGDISFDAPKAEWNVSAHKLDVPTGARLKNKDLDLVVGNFDFNSQSSMVTVPGEVTGKVYGGDLKATTIRYNVNDGSMKTGPIEWQGKIALSFQEPENPNQSRIWQIKAEGMSAQKGDIQIYEKGYGTDGDIIIMADTIERSRKTDVVTATGNVRYFSAKANMVCEKAVIERKNKKAVLTGNVQMLMKAKEKQDKISMEDGIPPYRPIVPDEIAAKRPSPPDSNRSEDQKKLDDELRSSKNMRDYPTICYAEKIEYWYKKGDRHAIITGNPQARQELAGARWRQIWTNRGEYDGEKETLKMISTEGKKDTRMIDSIGDDLIAEWVSVSTKEEVEDWQANKLEGNLVDESDEVPRDAKPTTTPKTTTGGVQKPPPSKSLVDLRRKPLNRTDSGMFGSIGSSIRKSVPKNWSGVKKKGG